MPHSVPAEQKAISFVFTDIAGKSVRLTDLKGKWVLVHFWAYWCPLCWPEMPALNRLNERPDFAVIGISLDYGQEAAKVLRAIEQHNLSFAAHILGGARRDANAPFRQVGPVDFFPTSYLYAPDGEIVMYLPGQLNFKKVLAFAEAWRPAGVEPAATPAYALDTGRFKAALARYGNGGRKSFAAWIELADRAAKLTVMEQLEQVHAFFNQRILRGKDSEIWRQQDYWASPAETLGKGRGDSEDIAIAKYFTLAALGVPVDRLRLVYVKRSDAQAAAGDPVHMVLAYYPAQAREPLLLDDLSASVQTASQRAYLRPVFSFNNQDVWGDISGEFTAGGSGTARLPVWQETLRRARGEGFK